MKSFRTNKSHCKKCMKVLDAHSGLETQIPQEGDLSICGYCAHICYYDKDLNLNPLNEDQLNNLKQDKRVWNQLENIRRIIKEKVSNN